MNHLPSNKDFFTEYMRYVGLDTSEAPAVFHRWVCASIVGALLGRQAYLPFGHQTIYPNQYIMLHGSPGSRKGSAMGIGKTLMKNAGYARFAADKTSKERFLMDMRQFDVEAGGPLEELEALTFDAPAESYVYSGEFTDFIGQNNMDYITMLTNLWDNLPSYTQPKITGKSVEIIKPTVNVIGANTVQGFSLAFPPEALGNGFLSRVLMIYGEPNGVKVAWPKAPDALQGEMLTLHLKEIRRIIIGEMTVSADAYKLGNEIYQNELPVEDERFQSYATRRQTHLLKLSMILAATDLQMEVHTKHMIRANTMLAMAEKNMPKALGQYGKGKYSDISNRIVEYLARRELPATSADIYKIVHKDLSKHAELAEILNSLKMAEKIQVIQIRGKTGYMPLIKAVKEWPEAMLDMDWLTDKEVV